MQLPKNFEIKIPSNFKGLSRHDLINIKKHDGKNVVFTINTGRKEYALPYNLIMFYYLASAYDGKDFFNDFDSLCIGRYGIDRYKDKLTGLGLFFYNLDGVGVNTHRYLEDITNL